MAPGDQTTSEAVLEAVADRQGVAASELEPPLYEAIDPEALDSLFTNGRGEVSFRYAGFDVTVDHDGNVELAARQTH